MTSKEYKFIHLLSGVAASAGTLICFIAFFYSLIVNGRVEFEILIAALILSVAAFLSFLNYRQRN